MPMKSRAMAKPDSSNRQLPTWRITRIKGKAAVDLGAVKAPDAKAAVATAIKQFEITDPEQRKRVAARRER
jgi:hypothetical protein